jgi:hypothetical protein
MRNLAALEIQTITPRFAELLLCLFAGKNQMVVTLRKPHYE